MTVTCRCVQTQKDGHEIGHQLDNQPNCDPECVNQCKQWAKDTGTQDLQLQAECIDTGALLGISLTVIIGFIVISIAILVLMVWFSVHVMNKCKGKPKWLNPTVITLLVLWLLMGWFPPLGLVFFIVLLVILIMYNGKCKKR
jgi:hypothetical protein